MANTTSSTIQLIVEGALVSIALTTIPVMSLAIDLATCIVLPSVNVPPLLRCQSAPICATVCYDGAVNVLLTIQVPGSLAGTELPPLQSLNNSPLLVIAASMDCALCHHGGLAMVG